MAEHNGSDTFCFNRSLITVILILILVGVGVMIGKNVNQKKVTAKSEASTADVFYAGAGDRSSYCYQSNMCSWIDDNVTLEGVKYVSSSTFCVKIGKCAGDTGFWCQKAGQPVSTPPVGICRRMNSTEYQNAMNPQTTITPGTNDCYNMKGIIKELDGESQYLGNSQNTTYPVQYVRARVYTGAYKSDKTCQVAYANCCYTQFNTNTFPYAQYYYGGYKVGSECVPCANTRCSVLRGKAVNQTATQVYIKQEYIDDGDTVADQNNPEYTGKYPVTICLVYTGLPTVYSQDACEVRANSGSHTCGTATTRSSE